ncbi:WD repeat-containing protein 75 [Lates japonicus]|uniref:WD repeat-containing protein 75 n=1 Tax=Lates japonicus TaxID=270547 RepID=A0AAD3MD84_LATJO|nr:WD repeat-containing protein 75 [Lates japonicus]
MCLSKRSINTTKKKGQRSEVKVDFSKNMVEHGDIRVVHRGGSKINFREPVITNDSSFLLCASGECVKVFSTSTEECIHDLRGHTDLVTGVLLKPSNHLQVYSCSADGTVRLWDFTDGILIKTYVIGYPIYSIYASPDHEGIIFIVTPMLSDKRSELFQLVAVHLPQSGDQLVEARELSAVLSDVSSNPTAITFGRGVCSHHCYHQHTILNYYILKTSAPKYVEMITVCCERWPLVEPDVADAAGHGRCPAVCAAAGCLRTCTHDRRLLQLLPVELTPTHVINPRPWFGISDGGQFTW